MGAFQLNKSKDGQFYFRLVAGNGETILASEMYRAKDSALGGIASVKKNAPMNERYDRRNGKNGQPYFVLKAGNHEIIGTSEMYSDESARDHGIESVKSNAPAAMIEDLTHAEMARH